MGKKLILLGVIAVFAVVLGFNALSSGASRVHADSANECDGASTGSPCVSLKSDAIRIIDHTHSTLTAGDKVETTVATALGAQNGTGSFYDAVTTLIKGITPGAVPVGGKVGDGFFHIGITGTLPCTGSGPDRSYDLLSGRLNGAGFTTGYPSGGTGSDPWANYGNKIATATISQKSYLDGGVGATAAYDTKYWIADFDDDNLNNIPDYLEASPDADNNPQTVQDLTDATGYGPPDGVPDGVEMEPLYIPEWVKSENLSYPATRSMGVAVIIPGSNLVPVDFVTQTNYPVAGTNSQAAVIAQGSGVGLTPGNPKQSGTVTCPAFESRIHLLDTSVNGPGGGGGGATVQTLTTGSGEIQVHMKTAADWDGDGVPNYNDNCDTVANPSQTDNDHDGIGAACDPNDASAAAADADGDGVANGNDSCPLTSPALPAQDLDTDSDGIQNSCDPNQTVAGDGNGYRFPVAAGGPISGAGKYVSFGAIDRMPFSAGDTATVATPACYTAYPPAAGTGGFCDQSSTSHQTPDPIWCVISSAKASDNPGLNCDASPDFNGDGAPDFANFTGDADSDGWPDACETGFYLYGADGEGSDALDATSVPNAAAIKTRLGAPNLPTGADCDGDGTPNATDPTPLGTLYDSDGDRCPDATEVGLTKAPNPNDPWDFYTVPDPALKLGGAPVRADHGIGFGDVLAVLAYTGQGPSLSSYDIDLDGNGVPDGIQYDRVQTTKYGGNWPAALTADPVGGPGVGFGDVLTALAQTGLDCTPS